MNHFWAFLLPSKDLNLVFDTSNDYLQRWFLVLIVTFPYCFFHLDHALPTHTSLRKPIANTLESSVLPLSLTPFTMMFSSLQCLSSYCMMLKILLIIIILSDLVLVLLPIISSHVLEVFICSLITLPASLTLVMNNFVSMRTFDFYLPLFIFIFDSSSFFLFISSICK